MKRLLLALLVLLLLAGGAGFFWINSVIKRSIEAYGSKITGTQVTLQSSHISLFSGQGQLNGLLVANPEGFSENPVFKFGEISMALDIRSLFSDVIIVKDVTIREPEISYEFGEKSRDTNIDVLRKNIKNRSGSSKEETKTNKKLIIENFRITRGKITVASYLFGKENKRETPLPELHLRDIGKKQGGLPPEQVSGEILTSLTGAMLGVVGGALKESFQGIKGAIKGLFN